MNDSTKPESSDLSDDWAAALAEQVSAESDDPWGAAMAEQQAASRSSQPASAEVFKPLDAQRPGGLPRDLDMIMDIPVHITVQLGRTMMPIKKLLELSQGSVVSLDGLAGEPLDILINEYPIAKGEVVVVDDKYGIRVTEIITPSERMQKMK